jgi:CrcB protein
MGLYLWIAIGSAIGGVARYWCSGVAARLIGETFPWGTLIVNVVGSFIIGFFATLTGPDGRVFVGTTGRQFVMVGLCGGCCSTWAGAPPYGSIRSAFPWAR